MPANVHSMKELLVKKRSLDKGDTVVMTKECSELIQRNLPTKRKDPGKFFFPVDFVILDMEEVLQVYKAMHPPRDSMNCMKMEEVDPTSKDKGPKKKFKEERNKTINSEELQQIPKAPNIPSLPANMGSISKASSKDARNHYFEPP
ncbi:hypothetical protein PIB30_099453 [Stylosanthes scabra]|uniref:NET domain-containing protein n=1 Tax=Stylosanthes scabra TaxID=79078 RepID=A0ABU6TZ64_9FABA|nr:hypothetical protein [Stylosanthes scabra]